MGGVGFRRTVELVGQGIDAAGVGVIAIGVVAATVTFAVRSVRRPPGDDPYRVYRRSIGRAILLGLEFLVAGDIIRTVAISPTFTNVGVLGGIVLIRTFLSFSLEAEISGRAPWRREADR